MTAEKRLADIRALCIEAARGYGCRPHEKGWTLWPDECRHIARLSLKPKKPRKGRRK